MGLYKKSFLSNGVSALSLFNLFFSLLLSSHPLLSPSPLQNGSLYLQRL